MVESYSDFFHRVTGRLALPYQQRYGADPFSPTLLTIPTGLGKTDTVLVPYLYAHATHDPAAPTRLVIVQPRQNLTVQTAKVARERRNAAGLKEQIRVLELMGGSGDNDQTLRPDELAIIIATQDLYFSRALNRGYARRPPRWPIDFALYNQDCLIVLDEIQLMDDALATSTQLAAFRERFGTIGAAPSIWMSATLNPTWLNTVDFRALPPTIELNDDDRATPLVSKRLHAEKALAKAPIECRTPAGCAATALANHRPRTRSLIIANTVPRAREIHAVVRKTFPDAILLHSRFRPQDRRRAADRLEPIPPEGQIVVATQVLEAGVDITSRLLITDIAPWGSLVQRFGRVNRYGDDVDAEIWWVDQPTYAKQKEPSATPYSAEEVSRAMRRLEGLASAAPADLPAEDGPEPYRHVLRRADLMDLFDTTPDLAGNELDVSRFIRATEEKDLYLAWRDWKSDDGPPEEMADLEDQELCPVRIGEFGAFAAKHAVYTLNFATEEWTRIDRNTPLYPGMLAVTHTSAGGYTPTEGWSPDSKAEVEPTASEKPKDTDTSDTNTFQSYRQTLRAHTDRVREKLELLIGIHDLEDGWVTALRAAAAKHDWGKAHAVFQETLHRHDPSTEVLAKQCGRARHRVKHFRHELASALAMLQTGESDLASYLAASHHGRVRIGIRSMPGEQEKDGRAVARGIRQGDVLPPCELATGLHTPEVMLSLDAMQFGAEKGSWTERTLRLRDELGPFRLAFLEMLLRAADEDASKDQGSEFTECPLSN
jgi:CRISPR-associated endonuclease/helicase Cas3